MGMPRGGQQGRGDKGPSSYGPSGPYGQGGGLGMAGGAGAGWTPAGMLAKVFFFRELCVIGITSQVLLGDEAQ